MKLMIQRQNSHLKYSKYRFIRLFHLAFLLAVVKVSFCNPRNFLACDNEVPRELQTDGTPTS